MQHRLRGRGQSSVRRADNRIDLPRRRASHHSLCGRVGRVAVYIMRGRTFHVVDQNDVGGVR